MITRTGIIETWSETGARLHFLETAGLAPDGALSEREAAQYSAFVMQKRRSEWLAGRLAAKVHDKRTTLARDVQKAIADVFGDRLFKTTISKSIRLEESPAHKESIFTNAPQSSGAYEYYRLCEEVIERVQPSTDRPAGNAPHAPRLALRRPAGPAQRRARGPHGAALGAGPEPQSAPAVDGRSLGAHRLHPREGRAGAHPSASPGPLPDHRGRATLPGSDLGRAGRGPLRRARGQRPRDDGAGSGRRLLDGGELGVHFEVDS